MYELKIAHINARSLLAGFTGFKENLLANNYDLYLIGESWLGDHVDDNAIQIRGYNLVRQDRLGGARGGGVCMYIHNSLKFEIIEVGHYDYFEQLWIKIKVSKKVFYIGVMYRPPNTNVNDFLDSFEDTLSDILPNCDDILCLGDINIDLLNLENHDTIKFSNLLNDLELSQLINDPTRISVNKLSLIDVIICSGGMDICSSGVSSCNNLQTDHELIYCTIKRATEKLPHITKTFRDFKNFNYENFINDLQSLTFYDIFFINDIENKLLYFNELIISLFDNHAPLRTVRCTKPKAPWLTENIKLMMNLRDHALSRYKNSKNPEHYNYYKILRNNTTKAIENEKKAYLNHRIRTGKSKTLWKDLDNLNVHSSKKKNIDIPAYLSNVNEINNFFIDSAKNIPCGNLNETKSFYTDHSFINFEQKFSFSLVSNDEVFEIIRSLSSNAVGYDKINLSMITYCCPYIIPFITHIINTCILENYFPNLWKTSVVIPLPKVSQPNELKHLRPISILPPLSKVLERILSNQLKNHLTIYDILPSTQSGFRKNYSCSTALSHITDDILTASDQNELTVLILLDYSKAFDCINHEVLLSILSYIGLGQNALHLLNNYLTNRKQIVMLNNDVSQEGLLDRGVPQGSILGPLLFSIYTSQLHTKLKTCKVHCYADDTQLYKSFMPGSIVEVSNAINSDLNILINSSKDHGLCINPTKSAAMLFGKAALRKKYDNVLDIKIDDTSLNFLDETKNLGLIIDTDLRFKTHINTCIKKAFCNLKKIYACRNILCKNTIKLLCDALVLSNFSYCDVIYGPCLDVMTSKRVQRIQNSCTRIICGVRRSEHISHKIKEIGWLNMNNRRLLHSAIFYHKIITTETPSYLYNKIRFRTDVHNVNIRRKSLITPPIHKTKLYERSFRFNIYKIYNNISTDIKSCDANKYKRKLKKILLENQ